MSNNISKKILVAYHSQYGSTRQYAEWICQSLQCDIIDLRKAKQPNYPIYDIIIFGGYLFIGRNSVAPYIRRNWPVLNDKTIFIYATGGANPGDPFVEKAFENSFPVEVRQQTKPYYFPGKMCHKKLSLIDKLLMFGGTQMIKDPEVKKGMKADFDRVKHENINPLIQDLKSKL